MNNQKVILIILTIFLILTVILSGAIFLQKNYCHKEKQALQQQIINLENQIEAKKEIEDLIYFNDNGLDNVGGIISPKEILWADFLKEHNSLSKENSQFIENIYGDYFSFVVDEVNPEIIYFGGDEPCADEAYIYSLNLKTNELKELYKMGPEETGISDPQFPELDRSFCYYLIGKQDKKLLLGQLDSMSSPGPCFDFWPFVFRDNFCGREYQQIQEIQVARGYSTQCVLSKDVYDRGRSIKALDLDNPKAGLTDFEIPLEKFLLESLKEGQCIKGLQGN